METDNITPAAGPQMKKLMDHDTESIRLVMDAIREQEDPPAHSSAAHADHSVRFYYLRPDRRSQADLGWVFDSRSPNSKTKRVKDFVRNLLSALHRHTLSRLRRGG